MRHNHELSWADLSSLTAYRELEKSFIFDQDNTPAPFVSANFLEKTTTFQQEFLLTGSADRFDWTLGAFYFHEWLWTANSEAPVKGALS